MSVEPEFQRRVSAAVEWELPGASVVFDGGRIRVIGVAGCADLPCSVAWVSLDGVEVCDVIHPVGEPLRTPDGDTIEMFVRRAIMLGLARLAKKGRVGLRHDRGHAGVREGRGDRR